MKESLADALSAALVIAAIVAFLALVPQPWGTGNHGDEDCVRSGMVRTCD